MRTLVYSIVSLTTRAIYLLRDVTTLITARAVFTLSVTVVVLFLKIV